MIGLLDWIYMFDLLIQLTFLMSFYRLAVTFFLLHAQNKGTAFA